MSKLFVIAGTKGGIGKSYFATFLIDVAFRNKFQVHVFDADEENRTLTNLYQKVSGIEIRGIVRRGVDYPLDFIVNEIAETERKAAGDEAGNHIYVVDMKAGTSDEALNWIQAFPIDELSGWGVEIFIAGCFTSDLDSVLTFLPWTVAFSSLAEQNKIKFIVVKNLYHGEDFGFYDENLRLALEEKLHSPVVTLSCLESLSHKLKLQKQSYGRILDVWRTSDQWSFMEQHRAREEFRKVSEALALIISAPNEGEKK